MSSRLQGGSDGESIRGGYVPFFHQGVKAFDPSSKNTYGVRVLPAFDLDQSNTPTSPTSIVPYRYPDQLEAATGKEKFTPWYYPLKGYKFTGKEKKQFLSPLSRYTSDKRGVDPLWDCFLVAKTSKDQHPEWHTLTEKKKNEKNAVLENFRTFAAMNVVRDIGQNKLETNIMVLTGASMRDFKEQLDIRTPWGAQPLDPKWPQYLLGDITSPEVGLWGIVKEGRITAGGMQIKCSLISFSQARDQLIGHRPWPMDLSQAWAQDYLAKRYNIADTDKVTKILSGEEILQFLVDDGFLPPELIHEACGEHWTVPASHTGRVFSPPPVPGAAPTPPSDPAEDAEYGPVSGREFWVTAANGTVIPKPITDAQLRSMVSSQRHNFAAVLVSEVASGWKTAADYGIVPPAAPVQPPPPPAANFRVIAPPPPVGYTPSTPAAPAAPVAPLVPSAPPVGYAPSAPAPQHPYPQQAPPTPQAPPQAPPQQAPPAPYGAPPPGGYALPTPPPPGGQAPPTPPSPAFGPPPGGRPNPVQPANQPPAAPPPTMAAPQAGPTVQTAAQAGGAPPPPGPSAPLAAPVQPPTTVYNAPVNPSSPPPQVTATPMNQAELDELMILEKKWAALTETGAEMSPVEMNRYCELSDRYAVLKQNGGLA